MIFVLNLDVYLKGVRVLILLAAYDSLDPGSQFLVRVKLLATSKVLNGPWLDCRFPAGLPKSTTVIKES